MMQISSYQACGRNEPVEGLPSKGAALPFDKAHCEQVLDLNLQRSHLTRT
jgi:hypothetical protein